jgi:F-type H+-transporting ATPase subunit delta
MNESQISVRYAKALFESAAGQQLLERVYADMALLADVCRIREFNYMLITPSLQDSRKCALVDSVLKAHVAGISLSMIHLVIRNKREEYLPGIARNFRDLYRRSRGIKSASLTTAQQVDESVTKRIGALIKKTYKSGVELTASVDEEMIGGFILTIEDRQYDASVSSSLKKMKKQLIQTHLEKK